MYEADRSDAKSELGADLYVTDVDPASVHQCTGSSPSQSLLAMKYVCRASVHKS